MKKSLFILFSVFLMTLSVSAQNFYRIERLPVSTRTYSEMAPFPVSDGIVYLSNRPMSSYIEYKTTDGQYFSDIYFAARKGEKEWGTPEIFSEALKTDYHDGPVSFANDGNLICFSRMYKANKGEGGQSDNAGIFFADMVDGSWTNIRPFERNDPEFSFYSPFLTPDGNTLYFAATLGDSRGGHDIYVSKYTNGKWSVPVNLGDQINTPQDEMYPFLHASGRLYFSSKGHDTSGGSDIFYCDMFMGSWSKAVKLPGPINSGADDYTLIMSDDFSEGYFTSKRTAGSADIYRFYTTFPSFENPRPVQPNRWCFRLRENSLDTIDYSIFSYEWVINDTLHIPGHDIKYCFPGPGDYELMFNVTNKLIDTTMYGVGNLFLPIRLIEQPVITLPDTVIVNQVVNFSARDTYLPNFSIGGYYWDFGDGLKGEGITITHQYLLPGVYKVVLGLEEKVEKRNIEPEKKAVFKEVVVLPSL